MGTCHGILNQEYDYSGSWGGGEKKGREPKPFNVKRPFVIGCGLSTI